MKKAIVVGSGISGLSVSRMLAKEYEVKVLEKAGKIGGLIKCERVNGILFHQVGGHVFNSKNEDVLKWFWSHFDRENEFLRAKRNAKILIDNGLIGYPIENFLYQLPEKEARNIVLELLNIFKDDDKKPGVDNFEAFLKGRFGNQLYDLYFGPYNSKIWNTNLTDVPLEWLEGKLPMPDIAQVIMSNIIRKEEAEMVHASFYYPKKDGSQFIVNRLQKGLDITVSYPVSSIKAIDNSILVNDTLSSNVLIYCGDVRKLADIIEIQDEQLYDALHSVTTLRSNGTSNVLCKTDNSDLSWLYLPEDKFCAHRIIYTGNFSDTNNDGGGRSSCVVEFSGKHNQEEMKKELALLPGNLKAVAFNYEPNSYIIQNKDTREKISVLKAALNKYNIYLLGRFAEWEYYNMDKCIERAMEVKNQLGKTVVKAITQNKNE